MREMDENQDVGGSAFETRIRALFEDGTSWRNVSATAVVRGARRRRMRHRATAAGASFAVVGVAAAGVVAFGGHSAGPSRVMGISGAVTAPTSGSSSVSMPTPSSSPSAPSSKPSSTSVATTCSASVSGTTPTLTHTTADGLDFETVSGSTAGIPWSVQIHTFPDWQTYVNWYGTLPGPSVPSNGSHQTGQAPALFRQSGSPQLMPVLIPGFSFGFVGHPLRGGAADSPKKYVVQGWTASTIDHLCLQFAHHADFEPVYRIQGGTFAVFGYTTADEPQKAIGYDAAGHVVATLDADAGLLMPSGLQN